MLTGAWTTNPIWSQAAHVALQFLWQASVLTAALLLLERLLRPASADIRYRRTLATLIAVAIAPLATAAVVISRPANAMPVPMRLASDNSHSTASQVTRDKSESRDFLAASNRNMSAVAPADGSTAAISFEDDSRESTVDESRALPFVAGPASDLLQPSTTRVPAQDETGSNQAQTITPAEPTPTNRRAEVTVPRWLLPACISVWVAGVAVFLLRLLTGLWVVRGWSRRASELTGEAAAMASRLGRRMGFQTLPPIYRSEVVQEPLAVGIVRPRIYLPAAWTGDMPAAGLEAVLAHELAHVRRGDLWVNFLQRVIEAVWFFHPAVWWLTRRVRADRELCCDREAVEATGRPLEYATALEFVAERAWAAMRPGGATGMGEESMAILKRVKTVLGAPSGPSPTPWWWLGTLSVAIPAGLWLGSVTLVPARADDGERKPPADAREAPKDGDRPRAEREGDRPPPPPPREGARGDERRPPGPPRDGEGRPGPRDERGGPGSGDRGPGDRGPGDRGRGPGPGDRGPGDRGPGPDRGPGDRGPDGRGPGDRGPGDRGPVPPHEDLMHMIRELHREIGELRREVRELREMRGDRGPGPGGPREGFRGPRDGERGPGPDGPRGDVRRERDRGPDGGPRPDGPRPDGPRREGGPRAEGERRPPEGDRRPEAPPRDGDRKPNPPDQPRGDGERKPAPPAPPRGEGERKPDQPKPEGERR